MLSAHVGSTVCMAGRLAPGSGGTLEMDTSDKGKVVVRGAAAAAADLAASPFMEIIGKVEADKSLSYVSGAAHPYLHYCVTFVQPPPLPPSSGVLPLLARRRRRPAIAAGTTLAPSPVTSRAGRPRLPGHLL